MFQGRVLLCTPRQTTTPHRFLCESKPFCTWTAQRSPRQCCASKPFAKMMLIPICRWTRSQIHCMHLMTHTAPSILESPDPAFLKPAPKKEADRCIWIRNSSRRDVPSGEHASCSVRAACCSLGWVKEAGTRHISAAQGQHPAWPSSF